VTVAARYLVRYGAVPEVARFDALSPADFGRGAAVVVTSPRGVLLGTVLDQVRTSATDAAGERPTDAAGERPTDAAGERPTDAGSDLRIERVATAADLADARRHREEAEAEFPRWLERIAAWGLQLELIDLEFALDGSKRILYVLTERGPETTKLALQAAAAGLGLLEVQPVSAEGLMVPETGGGCGSGGGGCGCH
jgi:hypothetical protein